MNASRTRLRPLEYPMQLTSDHLARLAEGNVVGPEGATIGGIGQIHSDDKIR